MEIHVTDQITIPASELQWSFSKSSAPGGQGVNTTDSRVRLGWNPSTSSALPDDLKQRALSRLKCDRDGLIHVVAESERSQFQNRLAAIERMAEIIQSAIAPPPPPRRKTRPTRAAREERITSKRRLGILKRNRQRPSSEE